MNPEIEHLKTIMETIKVVNTTIEKLVVLIEILDRRLTRLEENKANEN